MQKARRHPLKTTGSDRLQANGFRVYFTPLFEVLFTFPSRYWFTIGLSGVFSLTGWSPQIQTGFLVSRLTQDSAKLRDRVVYGAFTLFGPLSSGFHFHHCLLYRSPTTPPMPKHQRFGLLRVRSPLLTQSLLFSLPMGTQMFQFPTFAHLSM